MVGEEGVSEQVGEANGMLAAMEGLTDTSEFQATEQPNGEQSGEDAAEGAGVATGQSQEQGNDASTESNGNENQDTNEEQEASVNKPDDSGAKDDDFIDHPLFSGKVDGEANEQPASIDMSSFESLNPVLKKYGIEDVTKLPEQLESLSKIKQEYETSMPELDNARKIFATMPAELHKAVVAFAQGQDWRQTLGVKGINYETPIDKIDPKMLVDNYFPEKVSAEDWEEYNDPDGDVNVKRFVETVLESAKPLYVKEQNDILSFRDNQIKTHQERQQNFLSSLEESKKVFKTDFPMAREGDIENIAKNATPEAVTALLFNEDGTLKPDGLSKIAMMSEGKSLVDALLSKGKRKIESDVETRLNLEKLAKSANVPRVGTGSSESKIEISPEVQKQIDELDSLKG